MFEDLAPAQGTQAVVGMGLFLERLDALEKGRSDATREAGKKAADLLAQRGIDAKLAEQVKIAKSVAPPVKPAPEAAAGSEFEPAAQRGARRGLKSD